MATIEEMKELYLLQVTDFLELRRAQLSTQSVKYHAVIFQWKWVIDRIGVTYSKSALKQSKSWSFGWRWFSTKYDKGCRW